MFNITLIFLGFVLGALCGYVARKYAEKKWPEKARMADEAAQRAGERLRKRMDD
jgi:hypothetical protein